MTAHEREAERAAEDGGPRARSAHTSREHDTRKNVALGKLCLALGVPLNARMPEHELLEALADKAQRVAECKTQLSNALYNVAQNTPYWARCREIITVSEDLRRVAP